METEPSVATCPVRSELPHCWHALSAPIKAGPVSYMFQGACCFCAPTYLRITVLVPFETPEEELTAEQLKHGSLIEIMKQGQPSRNGGPRLLVPNNDRRH